MFRIRDARPIWAVPLMAAYLGAAPAQAAPVEQRCTDLGSACVCSEPLRYPAGLTLNEDTDPPDSEGAGAKECNGGIALDAEPNGTTTVASIPGETGLGFTGSNPPPSVLKMTSTTNDVNNGWKINGTLPTNVQNETICARTYQRFGTDLPPFTNIDFRIKLGEYIFPEMPIQHQLWLGGTLDTAYNADCTGSMDWETIGKSSWLRYEHCLDIGVGTIRSRQRMTAIKGGQTETLACDGRPGAPNGWQIATPTNFQEFKLAELFMQTMGNASLTGTRYVTYAIETRVPLNTSFWPGAAPELEGGAGSTPPPPPAPAPAPPPATTPVGKPGQPQYTP